MTKLQLRRCLLLAPLAAALAVAAGCASTDTQAFAKRLNPLVGKADKEFFIEKYGEPVSRNRIDEHYDVWEFNTNEQTLGDRPGAGNITTVTRLKVTFKDGLLASWQAYNTVR